MMSILHRIGQNYIEKKLKPYSIGRGQIPFLAELLLKDGVSQDKVASEFRCNKATSARAIQHLERHGYVERRQSEKDGRVKNVFVTDKARKFEPILFSYLEGWTELLLQGFTPEEREQIITLLHRCVHNATKARMAD